MNIPYGKVAIYLLTFITYAYSGYGNNILKTLRDAVISAESVFGDFFQNIVTVVDKVKTFNDIFDAAVDENCIFKCPGGETARPNRYHKPTSNGCGSLGIGIDTQYLPLAEMTKCCDTHDLCYDTCNSNKDTCDLEFKKCLYRYCESVQAAGETVTKACKGAAKMLFSGTTILGCKSYLDAQSNACYCSSTSKNSKKTKYTRGDEL